MSHITHENCPVRSLASNRDVIIHDPHPCPCGLGAYPIIARELRVEMQNGQARHHIVRFANGQHVRLSAAWVRPIPHVPGMGPVTSSLAECL